MNLMKFGIFAIALLVIAYIVSMFFGSAMFGLATIITTIGLLIIVDAFGILGKIMPFPMPKQAFIIGIIIAGLGVLMLGGLSLTGVAGGITGGFVPGSFVAPETGVTVTDCQAQARAINPDNVGKATTVYLQNWDEYEPGKKSVDPAHTTFPVSWYHGGALVQSSATASSNYTQGIVGDVISVYGGNTTHYMDPVKDTCIVGENHRINTVYHVMEAEASMTAIPYNDTDVLDTGGTGMNALEDYNLTLGAGSSEPIYQRLRVAGTDQTFQFCGWAVRSTNNISNIKPTGNALLNKVDSGIGFTYEGPPLFLGDANININGTGANISGYEAVYHTKPSSILMYEWDYVDTWFEVEAHATLDPVAVDTNQTQSNSSHAVFLALDCTWTEDQNGSPVFDYYYHNDTQTNAGFQETVDSPLGSQVGNIIEPQ